MSRDKSAPPPRREEIGPPPTEAAGSYQHPADHGWSLQLILDVKQSIGRLDERTERLREDVRALTNEVKGLPSRTSYWMGIGLVITVILGLAAIYWAALPARP